MKRRAQFLDTGNVVRRSLTKVRRIFEMRSSERYDGELRKMIWTFRHSDGDESDNEVELKSWDI